MLSIKIYINLEVNKYLNSKYFIKQTLNFANLLKTKSTNEDSKTVMKGF